MTARRRFRDGIRSYIPTWLSDRPSSKKTAGFRLLWSLIAPLDAATEVLLQGLRAAWPGQGTPTALPLIGRSRGILRGRADTDDEYVARLLGWLDRWRIAGSMDAVALAIHEYLANRPRVRVVNRAGHWVTVEADGTITRANAAWNWDGVSHPGRAGYWSEIWIIIYPTDWPLNGTWGDGRRWGRDSGIGHVVSRQNVDAVKGLIGTWKSAHTKVRAVIWTSDPALFDPAVPASCPNGTWGAWGTTGNGSRVASGRNLTSCRYWEL